MGKSSFLASTPYVPRTSMTRACRSGAHATPSLPLIQAFVLTTRALNRASPDRPPCCARRALSMALKRTRPSTSAVRSHAPPPRLHRPCGRLGAGHRLALPGARARTAGARPGRANDAVQVRQRQHPRCRTRQRARHRRAAGAAAVPGGLRKCVRGTTVLYTDKTCPPGSREQGVRADNVTVLPATQPTAPQPAGGQAPPREPLLRELAGPDDTAAMREKAIDRATR